MANNYDLAADDPCKDCCKYPELIVSIGHFYNGEQFNLGDTLTTTAGENFIFINYLYVLSQFQLITPDGSLSILDTVALEKDNVYVKDDITIIKRPVFQNRVGSFIYEGEVTGIKFTMGLPPILSNNEIKSDAHKLNSATDSLDRLNNYIMHRIEVAHGTDFQDTTIYEVPMNKGGYDYNFVFDGAFSTRGKDLQIKLSADYARWFRNVTFSSDKSTVEDEIFLNDGGFIYF